MNKFIKSILLVGLTTVFSCNPNLVDEPPMGATELDFFSNTDEFRQVTTGVYATLINYYCWCGGAAGYAQATWLLPGDDLTESRGQRAPLELFNGLNPNNAATQRVFQESYKMIQRANVVLEKVEEIDFSGFQNAAEVPMMGGEASFLRGYAYFKLFNMFGSVPIVTSRIADRAGTNTPKSPALDVLNQAIADFRRSLESVPEAWPANFAGRVTKNSARGMLMKALVFRANHTKNQADYTEALTVFNTITARMVPNFIDNFNSFTENNAESLFEIQASQPNSGNSNTGLANDGAWRGVENMTIYRGNQMQPGDLGSRNHESNTRFLATLKLLDNFGTDPRISVFLRTNDGFNGRIFQKYNIPVGVHAINAFQGGSMNNERILRYADVKLLAAEAMAKTNNVAGAITQVNEVRARARAWAATANLGTAIVPPANRPTTETNVATVLQWIRDERYVELAAEGHRYWDLKRWHLAGDIDLTGWGGGHTHFSTHLAQTFEFDVAKHLVFPLPQTEIDRNSAILENNPGY
jgi:starch-binding outer membrane protein, SusD/RagB family